LSRNRDSPTRGGTEKKHGGGAGGVNPGTPSLPISIVPKNAAKPRFPRRRGAPRCGVEGGGGDSPSRPHGDGDGASEEGGGKGRGRGGRRPGRRGLAAGTGTQANPQGAQAGDMEAPDPARRRGPSPYQPPTVHWPRLADEIRRNGAHPRQLPGCGSALGKRGGIHIHSVTLRFHGRQAFGPQGAGRSQRLQTIRSR